MFSQELSDYILRGKEEIYLEYKQSMKWNINAKSDAEKVVNFTIVRTMLAMSNNKDGGVIVVGRGQKSNGEFDMAGVKKVDLNSYKQDDIARFLNGVSDPPIHFSIERDYLNIKGKKKWFVVIRVPESEYLPVICIKKEIRERSKPETLGNMHLRKNAIYVRGKFPIESHEISSVAEWRELIDRMIIKRKADVARMAPHVIQKEKTIATVSDI